MRSVTLLTVHILVVLAKTLRPGGINAIIAENLLLKQQLIVLGRSRRKAPNLRTSDRFILGGLSLFISARRQLSVAVIMKPSTLLKFHRALVKCKYRRLFSNKGHRQPEPKGPSRELIAAIVELKHRNPRYGCPRIIGFGIHQGDVDDITICRMFNHAISGTDPPLYLSSDNDPIFRFHRWKANLRILDVTEIKSVPYVPMSHPFIEHVIGTIRREYLNHVPFWNSIDLE